MNVTEKTECCYVMDAIMGEIQRPRRGRGPPPLKKTKNKKQTFPRVLSRVGCCQWSASAAGPRGKTSIFMIVPFRS